MRYIAAAGLVILLLLVGLYCLLFVYQQDQRYNYSKPAGHDAGATDQQLYDPCRERRGLIDGLNCIFREAKADEDAQRSSYDLKAQQDMAKWALGMLAVSCLGLFATCIGLVYIAGTLKETRNAANAAESQIKLMETQHQRLERPYVFVHGADRLRDSGARSALVVVKVVNHGKLPALIDDVCVGITTSYEVNPAYPMRANENNELFIQRILPSAQPVEIVVHAPAGIGFMPVKTLAMPVLQQGESLFLRVAIKYNGPFSENHETGVCWRWRVDGNSAHFVLHGGDELNYTK